MTKIKKIIPSFALYCYHWFLALAGAVLFSFPSRKIKVIGVTGTNGKTTTLNLIAGVLEEAGYKVACLSSLQFKIGDKEKENKLRMTMPGRGLVQAFLAKAVEEECDYALVEVTSEGIAQHRHRFIGFEAAVFTNLSPEHIESHGSFEAYKKTKGRFFKKVKKLHILNRDDEHFDYFNRFPAAQKYYYGISQNRTPSLSAQNCAIPGIAQAGGGEAREKVEAEDVKADEQGLSFRIGEVGFRSELLGEFNVYNALAAVCMGLSQGVELETAGQAVEKTKGVPGRMELVVKSPFSVVVDYAFTPNALEKVYNFLRTEVKKENAGMICVLGACGGGRDKWKRPILGKTADKYCDRVIVTNEDPYDEDPVKIIDQVAKGVENPDKILDRRKAISRALQKAVKGDVVVITGKGAEPSIVTTGGEVPWDDRKVVREEHKKIYG